MSEFRPEREPLLWKLIEGLLISVLIVAAFVIAISSIVWDAIKHWWGNK